MEEEKKDIIDRHSKKRSIIIDDELLLNPNLQDYIHELIDISEISEYYDCIIITDNCEKMQKYLDHWALSALVYKKYTSYKEIKRTYKFLVAFCSRKNVQEIRSYYQCETLTR